jgi:hypothetical protein
MEEDVAAAEPAPLHPGEELPALLFWQVVE